MTHLMFMFVFVLSLCVCVCVCVCVCFAAAYGQFFLKWYSSSLLTHGSNVLSAAAKAFGSTSLAAKVAGIHW